MQLNRIICFFIKFQTSSFPKFEKSSFGQKTNAKTNGLSLLKQVLADFAVCDWWRYCKALWHVKFSKIAGNCRKFAAFSDSVVCLGGSSCRTTWRVRSWPAHWARTGSCTSRGPRYHAASSPSAAPTALAVPAAPKAALVVPAAPTAALAAPRRGRARLKPSPLKLYSTVYSIYCKNQKNIYNFQ